jgi:hypothetical protein
MTTDSLNRVCVCVCVCVCAISSPEALSPQRGSRVGVVARLGMQACKFRQLHIGHITWQIW